MKTAEKAKWRNSQGKCANCNNPPTPGKQKCQSCRDKNRKYLENYNATNKQRIADQKVSLRRRRESAGLCGYCGKNPPAGDKKMCEGCRKRHLDSTHRFMKTPGYPRLKKKTVADVRERIFSHYGRACKCCGESTPEFLQLDHMNNDGASQRREVCGGRSNAGHRFYRWVIKNNFPNDLQILCANCNSAKGFYGICPHQRTRSAPVCEARV